MASTLAGGLGCQINGLLSYHSYSIYSIDGLNGKEAGRNTIAKIKIRGINQRSKLPPIIPLLKPFQLVILS